MVVEVGGVALEKVTRRGAERPREVIVVVAAVLVLFSLLFCCIFSLFYFANVLLFLLFLFNYFHFLLLYHVIVSLAVLLPCLNPDKVTLGTGGLGQPLLDSSHRAPPL